MTTSIVRGNSTEHVTHSDRDRYDYDFMHCKWHDGWHQFNTQKDAYTFGVWINPELRQILTFSNGDEITTTCLTNAGYEKELLYVRGLYWH